MRKPAISGIRLVLAAAAAVLAFSAAGCSRQEAAAQPKAGEASDSVSVMDLVEECDVLAAHPDDPQRMAEGVDDDKIVPRLAVLACEDALKRLPDDPRFAFQLGRALLARNDSEKAVTLFQQAAKSGYAAAYGYLGDAYQFGKGIKADTAQARASYAEAVKRGFTNAEAQIEMLTFDPAGYSVPAVGLFYSGQLDALRTNVDAQTRNYVFSFVTAVGDECPSMLRPKSVVGFYRYRYPDAWRAEDDAVLNVALMGSIAEHDAKRFLRRHGCDGQVAGQMAENINKLFQNP
jgi:TPR repeat protein